MTEVRVVLVDDEPLARAGLRSILSDEPGVAVIGESATGEAAMRVIHRLDPDLVFLDIALPDLDGFDVIERLGPGRRPAVVFVTAHTDQALRAFEVRALDYVTKPLRRERVREAVARAREHLASSPPGRPAEVEARPTGPLALKVDGRVQLIDQDRIDWIGSDDDHVVVHSGPVSWRARDTLQAMERRLDPQAFVRIHRSTIVRLARVRELQPWFHGDYVVLLHTGAKLRLSRSYRTRIGTLLGRSL